MPSTHLVKPTNGEILSPSGQQPGRRDGIDAAARRSLVVRTARHWEKAGGRPVP
jgi:hypothetical protein